MTCGRGRVPGLWSLCVSSLHHKGFARKTPRMMRFFDMDDRARLPWRFYGATVSILARA
jgi:hypothetical protein